MKLETAIEKMNALCYGGVTCSAANKIIGNHATNTQRILATTQIKNIFAFISHQFVFINYKTTVTTLKI